MPDLRKRFEAFIRTLDGFESVDALLKDRDPDGKKRADYLLWDRTIIVEQKVLEIDPHDKAQDFVDDLMDQGRVVVYGRVPIEHVFSKLPDRETLRRQLHYKLTNRIDAIFSGADKQTRDTREIFSIPDAGGVLVILNENAVTLSPETIGHKIAQMFGKTNADGSVRYPHNTVAIWISEIHEMAVNHPTTFYPIISMLGPNWRDNLRVEYFANDLARCWAAFNGVPFVQASELPQEGFRPTKA